MKILKQFTFALLIPVLFFSTLEANKPMQIVRNTAIAAKLIPIIIFLMEGPAKPSISTILPTKTIKDTLTIEVHGEAGAYVYANGKKIGIIASNGTVQLKLHFFDGVNTISITLRDVSGNESPALTFSVNYDAPPVITLNGNPTVALNVGDSYTDAGATANDNKDGNITGNIQTTSNVDITIAGTYTVTYTVSDSAGNAADIVSRIVTVNENTFDVTSDNNTTRKIKILGTGSGGSHHMLFFSSDNHTVIESGDMGAASISNDGGQTFKSLISTVHAKDESDKYIHPFNSPSIPRLYGIVEHPTNPNWLISTNYNYIQLSEDRGKTWHELLLTGIRKTNKIIIRHEGSKYIAYFAHGYKHGRATGIFPYLGGWVDVTDIHNLIQQTSSNSPLHSPKAGVINVGIYNITGLNNRYYYGDIVDLNGSKLFVAGHGGLWVAEGDPKVDANWHNITDSIFVDDNKTFPIDHAVAIDDKLYVFAYGQYPDINATLGVYVHTLNDINTSTGKYNFTRVYKGLEMNYLYHLDDGYNKSKSIINHFTRKSAVLLKHNVGGTTYLYLFIGDRVYRLNVTNGSDTFVKVSKTILDSGTGKEYSKGDIVATRLYPYWVGTDSGAYNSFDKSQYGDIMTFGASYAPGFGGINNAYSHNGKIYISNITEFKISLDNGKTFNSFTSKVSNSNSNYDGMIKNYYGEIKIFDAKLGRRGSSLPIAPAQNAKSFWWSSVKNRGIDNMVTTAVAINPNNPNEIMQSYMDSATFFSDDNGNSWHYVAGLKAILSDTMWTMWIKNNFYAQDYFGIYKFNKSNLEFTKLDIPGIANMYMHESIRVRRYYNKNTDTLVFSGIKSGYVNIIGVITHFTDNSLRTYKEIVEIKNDGTPLASDRIDYSFKDIWCDDKYVYAIKSNIGIVKLDLNTSLSTYDSSNTLAILTGNDKVFSGLFDKHGKAMIVTKPSLGIYDRLTPNVEIRDINLSVPLQSRMITGKNGNLIIDGKIITRTLITLLGIDPTNPQRVLASLTDSHTVIESLNGGNTWHEFIPQLSGNTQKNQAGNIVFAPDSSPYDVIILGTGSCYGVLK